LFEHYVNLHIKSFAWCTYLTMFDDANTARTK